MTLKQFQSLSGFKKDFAAIYYKLAVESGTDLNTTIEICNSNKMIFCIPFMKIFVIANYNKICGIIEQFT